MFFFKVEYCIKSVIALQCTKYTALFCSISKIVLGQAHAQKQTTQELMHDGANTGVSEIE